MPTCIPGFNWLYLIFFSPLQKYMYNLMLEPYAMKVARTVPRGGSFSNKITYLNRPYAALLLLIIEYDGTDFSI